MESDRQGKKLIAELQLRWAGFLVALFDPWTAILFATTVAFVWGAAVQKNAMLTAVFSTAASVCSGLFGGVVTKRWQENVETQILQVRARSAIRNLKLLLGSLGALERRVSIYLERVSTAPCSQDFMGLYLEEILDKCNTVHEETINAIENWTDIIPEADVTTQIGKIGALQGQISDLTSEAERLRSELDSSRTLSATEVEAVRLKLADKEKELQNAKTELTTRRTALSDVLSTSAYTPAVPPSSKRKCPNCGEPAWMGRPARSAVRTGWKLPRIAVRPNSPLRCHSR